MSSSDMLNRPRRLVKALSSSLVLVGLISTGALAQSGGPPGGPGGPDGPGGKKFSDIELMKRFDLNKDERLDREERDAARPAAIEKKAESQQGRKRRGGPPRDQGERATRPQNRPDAVRMEETDVEMFPDRELYDRATLRTFFFEFPENDWHEEMVAFHGTDVEVPGTLRVDGELIGEVGISYRGNTSFERPEKKSFGVSIDAYEDDLSLYGYNTLNLLNANGDPSMMREVLFSNIASDHMPAPKANFVKVVVNGVYLGVYSNVQQLNKDFIEEHYDTRKGIRWKVPPDFTGGGALSDQGSGTSEYKLKYELKTGSAREKDWKALVALCRVLKRTPKEEFEEVLPKYIDVEETIRFLALDNILMDQDGYYSRGSDYYIYKDPDGTFHFFHYDNNETFDPPHGGGPGGPGRPDGPRDGFGGPDGPRPGGFGPPPEDQERRRPGLDRPRRGGGQARPGQEGADDGPPRGGGRRGGRGGPGRTSTVIRPLSLSDQPQTRPLIHAVLSVPAFRERYLEVYRQIATEELQEDAFRARIDAYRTLISDAVAQDPFGPDQKKFLESLDGTETSLTEIVSRRRKFLLEDESLTPDSDDEDDSSDNR